MLVGKVAERVRDLLRQIAMEHEVHIISGKVAADHVHMFFFLSCATCDKQVSPTAQR